MVNRVPDLQIRSAVPARDLPGIMALNRLVQDIHVAAEPSLFRASDDMPGLEEFHLGLMGDEDRYTFVAESGTNLAGYVSLEVQRRAAQTFTKEHTRLYVHQISVHPQFRRHGVGRALLSRVDALAAELGMAEVGLDTWGFNAGARHFFEALGYSPYNVRLRKSRQLRPSPEETAIHSPPELRPLEESDADAFAQAFTERGWNKPASQFTRYLREQHAGQRTVIVAEWGGRVAGYVTVVWESNDPVFRSRGIPEINDFNVLLKCRRRGIGSALMDAAEAMVADRSPVVGLGVGLHPGYGSAQRLYVRRGYMPDGAGVVLDGRSVPEGSEITLDDSPMLRMTKELPQPR